MRELIWGKTLRSRLIRYNFFIIWVIAIFVSVCTYITASRKTMEVAKNSLQHHVESISYRYELAYEEMINIVLNCTERKTFNLGEIGGDLRPGQEEGAGLRGAYQGLLRYFGVWGLYCEAVRV